MFIIYLNFNSEYLYFKRDFKINKSILITISLFEQFKCRFLWINDVTLAKNNQTFQYCVKGIPIE